jgi:hypothetical protein
MLLAIQTQPAPQTPLQGLRPLLQVRQALIAVQTGIVTAIITVITVTTMIIL